jgi:flagellum-specific ATP synthase
MSQPALMRGCNRGKKVQDLARLLSDVPVARVYGRVSSVQGLLIEVTGPQESLRVGARITIPVGADRDVMCEIVGFRDGRALCLPFGSLDGVRMGCKSYIEPHAATALPSRAWLGRVINAFGSPIDGKGVLPQGRVAAGPCPSAGARQA